MPEPTDTSADQKPLSVRATLVITGLVALAICLPYVWEWSWPAMTRPYAAAATPKIATSQSPSDAIEARMWTGSGRISSTCEGDNCVRVDFEFRNSSNERIEKLHFIDFKAPGFWEAGNCWPKGEHYPSCIGSSSGVSQLPSALDPGGSIHIWAQLKPSVKTGRFGLLAVYGWSQKSKTAASGNLISTSRFGSILLQPIEITSPLHEAVGSVEHLLQGLLLPILIAILAYIFQRLEKNREIRREKLEKKQELRRARLERKRTEYHDALETERTRRHEVWKEQLERMLRYTPEHYTHISRAIVALTRSGNEPKLRDRVFYDFLMFWLHVRALREQKGGWFLSTKTGENALTSGFAILVAHMRTHWQYPGIEPAVDLVRKPESLPSFTLRFEDSEDEEGSKAVSELVEVRDNFLSWVDAPDHSFHDVLYVLTIFRHILRFEWDRPLYTYWYEEAPSFPFDECERALNLLPSEPEDLVSAFKRDFSAYVGGVRLFLTKQSDGKSKAV